MSENERHPRDNEAHEDHDGHGHPYHEAVVRRSSAVQNHPPLDVAEFNARFPIGSKFIYYSVILPPRRGERTGRGDGIGREVVTRSGAWPLGDGEPVVMIEGQAGGVALRALATVPASVPLEEMSRMRLCLKFCAGVPNDELASAIRRYGKPLVEIKRIMKTATLDTFEPDHRDIPG